MWTKTSKQGENAMQVRFRKKITRPMDRECHRDTTR